MRKIRQSFYMATMCAPQEHLKFLTPPTSWSHRDAIAPNYEGDTAVGNLLVSFTHVFVWRKMSDDIDDHSKQKQSLHDGTEWPHDGLTRDRLGIRYQHERVISQYHRAIFWHAKDFSIAHDVADEAWQTKPKVIPWHKIPSRMAR